MAFDAKEDKIVKLLSQNLLEIPRNQRKYVWDKTNWSDLLSDIKFIVDNPSNAEHFLGSIVLRSEDTLSGIEKFSIIDGQQRTITIILFLLALIRIFKENKMEEDVEGTLQYLFLKDRKNVEHLILHSDTHIVLKDLSEAIRKSTQEDSIAQILSGITVSKSEKVFINGFEYFYSSFKDIASKHQLDYLVKIKDSLLDARYIRIKAYSDADAYTVFEILNARGLTLEDYELLKNYIMRYIQPKEKVDEVKVKWSKIENNLGKHINAFFRHYVTHIVGTCSTGVYRTLQSKFPKDKVADLLNDLYKKSSLYNLIVSPDQSRNSEEYEILSYLKSSRSSQLRPLILSLLSAYNSKRIDEAEYLEYLQFIKNFFVCFTIISSEKSNKLTEIIEKYAPAIEANPSLDTLCNFIASMRNKLPTIDTFKRTFIELGYSNHYEYYKDSAKKNQVLAALKLIESYLSPGFSFSDVSIEHISADSDSKESATIGNLTLLERKLNEKCKDKSIEEKITIYSDSNFRMTRSFSNRYKENPSSFKINVRAMAMADLIYNKILKLQSLPQ